MRQADTGVGSSSNNNAAKNACFSGDYDRCADLSPASMSVFCLSHTGSGDSGLHPLTLHMQTVFYSPPHSQALLCVLIRLLKCDRLCGLCLGENAAGGDTNVTHCWRSEAH